MEKVTEANHPLIQFRYCPKCGSTHFEIINKKAKSCRDCGFVYYFNPSAAVAVFVTDKKGNLLVCTRKNDPMKGTYDLPGGFVDCDETVIESAQRELLEETGIAVKISPDCDSDSPFKFLFSYPNIYPYSGFNVHTLDIFFELELESLDPYVGKGADDVEELFSLPISAIDISLFGLSSIQKAVCNFQKIRNSNSE